MLGPEELASIGSSPLSHRILISDPQEGTYGVEVEVARVRDQPQPCGDECWSDYRVTLRQLLCVRESEWDRGSNSDEPMVLALLVNSQGNVQKFRTEPFDDVDAGERRSINHSFDVVRVNKAYGGIAIAVRVMESDDESARDRNRLLDEFANDVDEETRPARTMTLIGDATGADWKIGAMSIFAFTRGPRVRAGYVYGGPEPQSIDQWIDGRSSRRYPLTTLNIRTYVDTARGLTHNPPPPPGPSVAPFASAPIGDTALLTPAPSSSPSSPAAPGNTGRLTTEPGIDYYGGDYTSFVPGRTDPAECLKSCARDGRCIAYTFVRPAAGSPTGRCYLKSTLGKRTPNACCISGMRQAASARPVPRVPGLRVPLVPRPGALVAPVAPPAGAPPQPAPGKDLAAGLCASSVQGNVPSAPNGPTTWAPGALAELCRGAESSPEPGNCYRQLMSGTVSWGGGTVWAPANALALCAGSRDGTGTVKCFAARIAAKELWSAAIAACKAR